jgi:hypothetical protein
MSKRGKSRQPLAIKKEIARLLFEGRSKSAIGDERLGAGQQPQIERRAEKYRKIPLDVVPLAERKRVREQLRTGELNREMLSPVLLEADAEYDPSDPRDTPPPVSAEAQRPPNPHLEPIARELLDGAARVAAALCRASRPGSGQSLISIGETPR